MKRAEWRARVQGAKKRDYYGAMREAINVRLQHSGHHALRAILSRAVIGEPFNRARVDEVLVSFRLGVPVLVQADWLDGITRSHTSADPEVLYQRIKVEARRWAKKRHPVRHPKFKER